MSMLRRLFSVSPHLTYLEASSVKPVTFQCIDIDGNVHKGAEDYVNALSKDFVMKMYKCMLEVHEFDSVFYDLQRQGEVSFYMQNTGEEGLQVSSAAALQPEDVVLCQYRELGVFFWRGFGIQQACHQMYGNCHDLGEGKQMPVHYGSRQHNLQTISSPLGTQIPQAAGVGYGFRLENLKKVAICYFGEGAASEGDAHAALNFASTLKAQTLFICRNNQYAISTPTKDQFNSDGVVTRAIGYGMPGLRVDGNDIFAVYHGTQQARERILDKQEPLLLEFMTYRRGHHSTSDDSTRYREKSEVEKYQENNNPILRLERFLNKAGWVDFNVEDYKKSVREEVLKKKDIAKQELWPKWTVMFDNVYDTLPPNLEKQKAELAEHLKIYGQDYELELHQS